MAIHAQKQRATERNAQDDGTGLEVSGQLAFLCSSDRKAEQVELLQYDTTLCRPHRIPRKELSVDPNRSFTSQPLRMLFVSCNKLMTHTPNQNLLN